MSVYHAPARAGLDPERLARAATLLDQAHAAGQLPAAALWVARNGLPVAPHVVGRLTPDEDGPPVTPETIFLVASITKPVTATAVMLLVERGQLLLSDRVADYLPAFGVNGKENIRVRHLLTHTSGLPDMLPDNVALREAHAPLAEFVRRTCEVAPDFAPGTRIQYQSKGIAVLGALVEAISGEPLPMFLRHEVFAPLGMHDTALGAHGLDRTRMAQVHLPAEQVGTNWHWNTDYWRTLGAPWGGMHTTVSDLFRFLQCFLDQGEFAGTRVLSPATVAEMLRDQTSPMLRLTAADYRNLPWGQTWGLGWTLMGQRLPEPGRAFFGDLNSPVAFGHAGATGCVAWADPTTGLLFILLTTEPAGLANGLFGRCSNLVAAAVC